MIVASFVLIGLESYILALSTKKARKGLGALDFL